MADSFTETTQQSWLGRVGDSIKSVLFGALLFVAAFPVLFWNEGRAIRTARSLDEGLAAVLAVSSDAVDAANEGRLVALSGEARTGDQLADERLALSRNAIRLVRNVEMYQWIEEKKSETVKKMGGGSETTTTYSYRTDWAPKLVDSQRFKREEGHLNPRRMELESATWMAREVKVGAFKLPPQMIEKIDAEEPLALTEQDAQKLPATWKERAQLDGDGYFLGKDPAQPKVGDLRIRFRVVKPQEVSLVARQTGSSLGPYQTRAGDRLSMVYMGHKSAQEMFGAEQSANEMLTWLLRLGGFAAMALGLFLVFKPLAVLADLLPFVGDLLGLGLGFFAGVIAFGLSTLTIALGWVFYRPLVGIPLALVAIWALGGAKWLGRRKKAAAAGLATA